MIAYGIWEAARKLDQYAAQNVIHLRGYSTPIGTRRGPFLLLFDEGEVLAVAYTVLTLRPSSVGLRSLRIGIARASYLRFARFTNAFSKIRESRGDAGLYFMYYLRSRASGRSE